MSVSARYGESRGGRVHVDAYDQRRSGHSVDVREHERSWPGSGAQLARSAGGTSEKIRIEQIQVPPSQLRHREPMFKSTSWNGKGYHPQKGDEVWFARLAFAEAAREILAKPEMADWIIWTAINRIGDSTVPHGPKYTAQGVIQAPSQFAATIPPTKDRNGRIRESLWSRSLTPSRLDPQNLRAYEIALAAARKILAGEVPDPTNGALYFRTGETQPNSRHARLRDEKGYREEKLTPASNLDSWYFYSKRP